MSETLTALDAPNPHPIHLVVTDDLERTRVTVFFRLILAIPHFVWWALWSLAVTLAVIAAWVVGIFAGRVPDALHSFMAAYVRYSTHLFAYVGIVADPYPGLHGRLWVSGRPRDRATRRSEPPDDPFPADPRDSGRDRLRTSSRTSRGSSRSSRGSTPCSPARRTRACGTSRRTACATRRRRTRTSCSSRSGIRASPTTDPVRVETVDYHTGGEPFRIVTGGVPAARGRDDPRAAALRAGAPRPRPSASRLRAARPRRHVRLPRRPAERRRRRPRGRLLPQRGVLDGVRPRDDRARHVGARLRGGRAP